MGATVKLHYPPGIVHYEPVFGGGVWEYQCWTQPVRFAESPDARTPLGPRTSDGCRSFTIGGRRFAVLPSLRLHSKGEPDLLGNRYLAKGRTGSWTVLDITAGAKAIVQF